MAATVEQRVALEERRRMVGPLLLRRQQPVAIQRALEGQGHVWSLQTIFRDSKALMAQWRREMVEDPSAIKGQEIVELDELERDAQRRMARTEGAERRDWIKLILAIKKQRAELLGLDAPLQVHTKSVQVHVVYGDEKAALGHHSDGAFSENHRREA